MPGSRHPLEVEVQQLVDGSDGGSKEMATQDALGFTFSAWVLEGLFIDMGKADGDIILEVSRDSDKVTKPESGKPRTRTWVP